MDNQTVKIFDKESILNLVRPQDTFSGKAYDYVKAISINTQLYISNIKTSFKLLVINNIALPISINDSELQNAYTCSPYTHHISYAYDELRFIPNGLLRFLCWLLLAPFNLFFRITKANKIVVVNNWLLSTCLYPDISNNNVSEITKHIKKTYSSHTIQWRSLLRSQHTELIDTLQDNGYILVPSRQVYIWKPKYYKNSNKRQRKNFNQDKKILQSPDMSITPMNIESGSEIKRAKDLYQKLYIDKYSTYNPQLTNAFFELVQRLGIIDVYYLHHQQLEQDAVIGIFRNDTTVTVPMLGYDVDQPAARKMYRACSAMSYQVAQNNNLTCNKSSGVPEFKRNRGCKPEMEYSAVYVRHLPWYRRIIWLTVASVLNNVAAPLMKKYEL
jgi:hypothetical protein